MSYLRNVADAIRSEVPERLIPPDSNDLFLLYAVLARAKGHATTVEDVHDAWTAWMESRGEAHRSMVPFQQLPESVQAEDAPFVDAIHAVASRWLTQ